MAGVKEGPISTAVGNIDVKLDRISIVGWIKGTSEDIQKIMAELKWEIQPETKAEAPWFKLERHVGGDVYETVAVLVVSVLLGLITAGLDFIIRYGLEFLIK